MINILIPMAGKNQYFSEKEFPYPMPLIEIGSKTIIELLIENLLKADEEVNFVFVVNNSDCRKFHLDSTLNILTNGKCSIIRLENETRGSACSALMAIEFISSDMPLLISNSDHIFDDSVSDMMQCFKNADAGIVTFDSVHPRWSYARTDEKGNVIETSEKHPISRNAIAGLYYFSRGNDFVDAAMNMIRKGDSINGSYFIAPVLNQMILFGKNILTYKIDNDRYHTFYTPKKIQEYDSRTPKHL